jgi:sugar transferase (PEP-CTERM/EpsH1 system associated)
MRADPAVQSGEEHAHAASPPPAAPSGRCILHLAHRVPYPPDKGDRIRSFHSLRFLAARHRVHLACLADEPVPSETAAALEAWCERVAVIPMNRWRWGRALGSLLAGHSISEGAFHSPALRRVLRDWTRDTTYDACLVSASSLVSYLRLPELRHVPGVVDLVDVDSQKWLDYAAASRGPKAWLYALEGRRLRKLEQSLPAWTHGVALTTPVEAAIFEHFAGPGTAQVVSNGVDLAYFAPTPCVEEPACVFVGALDYRPNVEGVLWLCREVWPVVKRERPDAKLFLVGRQPTPAVQQLARLTGVEVSGTVPDVRPWVRRSAVAVAPLHIARGVQNKVLEALAMGKAVVASPLCLAGLPTTPGVHLLAATTPVEWAATLLRLLADPAERELLGRAGRAFVETHHRWETCLEPLGALLESAMTAREKSTR